MGRIARTACTTLAAVGLATLAVCAPGAGARVAFTHASKLRNSPPKGNLPGGEPSVVFDRDGRHVYVVAPGGEEPSGGVGFWRSTNAGRSFKRGRSIGSLVGGGDSDVDIGADHTVYVADLEVVANALCRSHNFGRTFDSGCDTGIATNHAGPDSDREWVTPSPVNPNLVYFSYHDFAGEMPVVYRSESGGDPGSFVACGPVLAPGSQAEQNFATGGTNQGKPAIDRAGTLYDPILEPDAGDTVSDPYDRFYIAIARHGCDSGTTFKDVLVYHNPRANLANIFPYVVNRGKRLYAAVTGVIGKRRHTHHKRGHRHFGVYLFRSNDRGRHWSKPIRVNLPKFKASSLGAVTVGPKPRDVALGFYRTRTTRNPASKKNRWKYEVAISRSSGRRFSYRRITRHPIHFGAICTTGILCSGGRNLLDFSSVGVNPKSGCVMAVFAGDPYDTPSNGRDAEAAPYVSGQRAGCFKR